MLQFGRYMTAKKKKKIGEIYNGIEGTCLKRQRSAMQMHIFRYTACPFSQTCYPIFYKYSILIVQVQLLYHSQMLTKYFLVALSVSAFALTFSRVSADYIYCKDDSVCPNRQTCQEHAGFCGPEGCSIIKRCTAVDGVSTCPESDGISVSCFPLYCYSGICSAGRFKQLGETCTSTQCDSTKGLYCDLNNHKCQVITGSSCLTGNSVCKGGQDCCTNGKCCRSGTCPENGGSCAN